MLVHLTCLNLKKQCLNYDVQLNNEPIHSNDRVYITKFEAKKKILKKGNLELTRVRVST
jgi:hypothetical protein